jgi:Fis family transcriptional regulator, factor for inversion stimulation protein
MQNYSDKREAKNTQFLPQAVAVELRASSLRQELRRVVSGLYTQRRSYEDTVRDFQVGYILRVLNKHTGHLGKTADELGMHRNTLTRTIRELQIDWKHLGRAIRFPSR